ncbi:MAG: carbonic anhydrase family protein [Ardenticatenaceae bacterium]|nr:carbonic anhydrase family protein [Ardenticatenaceae bacterium]
MKKILIPIMIIAMTFLAACGNDIAIDPEAIATQASDVVSDARDAVEGEAEEVGADEETLAEAEEPAPVADVACDIAAIPAPSAGSVNVRFVNNSRVEMRLIWHDLEQNQLTEYTQLAHGESHDQVTYTGHEWLMEDEEGHLLKMYTASAAETQCVVVDPHFGYEGEDGPASWAELSTHYEKCGLGQEQSPIDLTEADMTDLENIVFEYGETAVNILNNGHTIQVDQVAGSQIQIRINNELVPFKLLQFHFHAPSEHAIAGQQFPIEMHLVHQAADKRLAVVGVMVKEGAQNDAFTPVWDHLPADHDGTILTGDRVQVASLLPADKTIYRYNGSLTTPPCYENVIWSVMQNPVEMSAEQIAAFTAIIEGNNRPLQPVNARDLQLDNTP